MWFYSITIFLSAFLLFEVQPVIAKIILPWFGGSSAVWSTCMLFFQIVLLLGYLYAHWLNTLAPRRQAVTHSILLAAGLATLPIIPSGWWKTHGLGQPSITILALLAATVGLPYFLVSATSPLLQAWYARSHTTGMPYRLFALSNFASLLALLSYPFLVEPNLASHTQAVAWSVAFLAFAAICGITAWRTAGQASAASSAPDPAIESEQPPGWSLRLVWLALAACASILLLAVTNHLTQDVAAIPFLWILPLTVYLLSFILCFEMPRLYHRPVFVPLLMVSLWFMADRVWLFHAHMPARPVIALLTLALFVCCMVCHGELSRLKPHPKYLTSFYVLVSLGGAAGGVFVGLVAPNLFHAYYEFPIGLCLTAALLAGLFTRALWKVAQPGWKWGGIVPLSLLLGGFLYFNVTVMRQMVEGYLVATRNFYGQLRVNREGDPRFDEDAEIRLVHGTINHGEQFVREPYHHQPVTYFCPESGIGRGMKAQEGRPRRIGILGMGCGTLAAYGHAGDTLRIYEINPQVLTIANRYFTYLKDTPAKVEVALGDGRLVLESEPAQQFDMLVMDAFSGDSVPVHLITREAFATYFRHLKPDGILAVNISNAYLNLEPVMERAANAFGKTALVYHYSPDDDTYCFSCSWTLIMDRSVTAAHPELLHDAKVLKPERPFRIWTDDFSNMFSILK
ncbi:MAG: fused MFS/spermidine synthase [Acidobacteriota bacterium]|nr:fused MFS/spermidine synthase [Acidobacteriota bacterium]